MNSTSMRLDHEAIHFIESLDAAAFDGYLRGEATGEQYRTLASQIARLQTLAFDILTELQRMDHLDACARAGKIGDKYLPKK